MELKDHAQGVVAEIGFWMVGFLDPQYPIEAMGSLARELTTKLRSLAIMALLIKADTDRFYHNLILSGQVWELFLKRCREDDHHCASGRYQSILDVIAAGDFDLAGRIGQLFPREWRQGHEYEDDYCFAQLICCLLQELSPEAEARDLLARFEVYLDGKTDARLDVCRALFDNDPNAFGEGFESLLREYDAKIAADKERGQMEDPEVVAVRQVSIEALAMLKLAETRGIRTAAEYRFCPAFARFPMQRPPPTLDL